MTKQSTRNNFNAHRYLAFFAAILIAFSSLGAYAQPKAAKRLLVISLDGLDTRYLHDADKYGLKIPTLRRLMANGVTARGMSSVFPSVTYPNHTSLVTGALPSAHGIFGNGVYAPPGSPNNGQSHWFARDIKTDTLWDAAKRAGMTVGLVSWPVGGGVGDWNVPEIWQPGGSAADTRAVVAKNSRPDGFFDELTRAVPDIFKNSTADEGDDARTRSAEYILKEKRPDVMLVHLFDFDHFQHDFGPFTPEAFAILEKTDSYVARMLAALESSGTFNETNVFITSDHGFKPISKQVHPGVLLSQAGLVQTNNEKDDQGRTRRTVTDWKAAVYVTGAACSIILRDPNDKATLQKIEEIFKPLAGAKDSGIFKVLDIKQIRKIDSNTNAAIMLDAADGYTFGSNYTGETITNSRTKGMHGYLPDRADYLASFIASGPNVKRRGSVQVLTMTDAGATIAATIGLKLRNSSGKAISISTK